MEPQQLLPPQFQDKDYQEHRAADYKKYIMSKTACTKKEKLEIYITYLKLGQLISTQYSELPLGLQHHMNIQDLRCYVQNMCIYILQPLTGKHRGLKETLTETKTGDSKSFESLKLEIGVAQAIRKEINCLMSKNHLQLVLSICIRMRRLLSIVY